MRRWALLLLVFVFGWTGSASAQIRNGVTPVTLRTPTNVETGTAANPLPTFSLAPGPLVSGVITSAMTATTSTSLVSATAGNYLYITSCQFSNDHATVDTLMRLQDGSGGTTLWTGNVPHGGGTNVLFTTPLKVPTLGNALFTVNVTTGSSTYGSCQGFRAATSY